MEKSPMNILALDTVTSTLSVTAKGPNGTVTISIADGGQHAERLIDAIDRAIALAGFSARETSLVVCAEGPGSFTGLRLGYSAAKAVELSANCPLLPLPTLPCYARDFSEWPGIVLSVLDAKKSRFYAQAFRRGTPVTEALDIDESGITRFVDREERVLVVGPDASLFAERLRHAFPDLDVTSIPIVHSGISAILCEFAETSVSQYTSNVPDHSGPVYVRKSDAETSG
jgi:tRNA threonylcarbamoyladenosine biosynthesis protein TsaB